MDQFLWPGINSTILIFLLTMNFGFATSSSDVNQAALDARAQLTVLRYKRAKYLSTCLEDFDLKNCYIGINVMMKEELKLEKEIKNLDPKVNLF